MSNTKKIDLPAMPFYVGDWLKCPEVRALPPDYRGLWFDLICYLWESTERGVMLKPSGKPYSEEEIIRIVGLDNQKSGIWLTSILENGVCCRRESDGAIFSKRMVRDEQIRIKRRESGSKGGNPKLLVKHKVKGKVNQTTNQITENENENKDIIIEDNINIDIYTDEQKKEFNAFNDWINKNTPRVNKMNAPFTIESFLRIRLEYDAETIRDYLKRMHNYKELLKKDFDSNLTIRNWMKKDGIISKKK